MSAFKPTEQMSALQQLELRIQQDLTWLNQPTSTWIPARKVDGNPVIDVVIIGGGMAGITVSGYLKRYGITNHVILDQSPAGHEGPWTTYARMETLRSPKSLSGPCMGIPSLTFRTWYEASFGVQAWEELDKIPTLMWQDYLIWLRRVLNSPVRNGVHLRDIAFHKDGLLTLTVQTGSVSETILCRRLVLATGRDGLGGGYTPSVIKEIPRKFWMHSSEKLDFSTLRNRHVTVIGAGASAMDNAATALEAGAARVDVLIRRKALPRVNKFTGIGSMGVVHGFHALPDHWKWRFLDCVLSHQTPPPRSSVLRVSAHKNAFFHLDCELLSCSAHSDHVSITTSQGVLDTDFIISATGFNVDLSLRPELSSLAPHIRFWKDRFKPTAEDMPSGFENQELLNSPDLGEGFEFQEKKPGSCPLLHFVHCFCFPATLSHGKVSGDIPAISEGAERLTRHITQSFFVEDCAIHYQDLESYNDPELSGDEWMNTPLPAR